MTGKHDVLLESFLALFYV